MTRIVALLVLFVAAQHSIAAGGNTPEHQATHETNEDATTCASSDASKDGSGRASSGTGHVLLQVTSDKTTKGTENRTKPAAKAENGSEVQPFSSFVEVGSAVPKREDRSSLAQVRSAMKRYSSRLHSKLKEDPGQAMGTMFTVMVCMFVCAVMLLACVQVDDLKPQPGPLQQHQATPVFRGAMPSNRPSVMASYIGRPSETVLPQPSRPEGSSASLAPCPYQNPYSRSYPAAALSQRSVTEPPSSSPFLREERPPTAGGSEVSERVTQSLCPGLLVPRGSECVLAVRCTAFGCTGSDASVDILDLSGKPVLKAQVCRSASAFLQADVARPRSWSAGLVSAARDKGEQPAVILKTTGDSSALALCYLSKGKDGSTGMDICRGDGGLYGRLLKDSGRPRYVLRSGDRSEVGMMFDGIFEDHAVMVTDDHQESLADAEPSSMAFDNASKYYRLRVSSNVDVGLVLCCLLSIDELMFA
eukprot:CAMPEP_0115152514 /NCGR_PEP_ID=MMETSP0227-20121206/66202_1 /TAXON_ID=89957 /ORGANISM="Polarella glacialis, Strain CCMP 1383" /LENGTH=474 /DNA_ID=CAMNT_0002563129 /DNA_START=141 /DNA_END=1565 /DNA_ORIENTATION=-